MSPRSKLAVRIGVIALVVLAVGAWGFYQGMAHAIIKINKYDIRTEGILQVGDPAPDLALASLDSDEPVRLSDFFATRPLVLVFGSYT